MTVQAGWLDLDQSPSSQGLNGTDAEWWSLISHASANAHVGRDGTIVGFKCRLTAKASVTAMALGVWRLVSGTNYTLIGVSQDIANADLGADDAVVEYTCTTPITGVLSTDTISLIVKPNGAGIFAQGMDDTETLPLTQAAELAGRFRWHDSGNTGASNPLTVGSNYDHTGGGSAYRLPPIAALMEAPKVLVVGDSIAEGSITNITYRRDSGGASDRSADGSFAQVGYRMAGWGCELACNTQGSNTLAQTYTNDLNAAAVAKLQTDGTGFLHVHCGVNDINGAVSWATYLSGLESILALCRTNNVKLILTSILPWTAGDNTESATRDTWNASIKAWAETHTDVLFFDLNQALGKHVIGQVAGNLWDLHDLYDEDGAHLTQAGAAAAGGALAAFLRSYELSRTRDLQQRGPRDRIQYMLPRQRQYAFVNS